MPSPFPSAICRLLPALKQTISFTNQIGLLYIAILMKACVMDNTITYLTTADLDSTRAMVLVQASILTYDAFDKQNPAECLEVSPPDGYDFVDYWTGVDAIFNKYKTVECYGVVFRSQQSPYTYIFAFRGTYSTEDLIDTFGVNHTTFVPYQEDVVVPSKLRVESGFYHIYSNSDGNTPSMQNQVFALVDKYQASEKPIDTLYITGHSLGSTLSTFFTLDMALSRPDIKSASYNYASPRVGNQAFVEFYQQQAPQQNPETRTIRIQNVYDKVPCDPFKYEGYQHLPYAYLVSFSRDNLMGKFDVIDNHHYKNYKTVLNCALESESGFCERTFDYDQDKTMKSVKPDPSTVCTYWL
ncbi:lipase family protein [Moorena sp. SIO1G6]|uniref:lipase family protein n=1 Tax=Moorena sp. SIO1G6 TaxID=2607840 RepID=UPI00257CB703|nr:lipase family protein [Moorena sp. SIO1G6]